MNERLAAPERLVQIERVLARLVIKLHESFLVLPVLAAFISAVRGKIEEVPDISRPQIRPLFDHLRDVLMVDALIFLAVVALHGMLCMEADIRVRAVLGKAYDAVREQFVIFIKESVILFQFAQIPAEVQIVACNIRYRN